MHAIDIIITSLLSSTRSDVQFEPMPEARRDVVILDFDFRLHFHQFKVSITRTTVIKSLTDFNN